MEGDRPWLLKIHCSNHRIELAVADAFKNTVFSEIDRFYIQNFYLLKNSGLLKSEVKAAASALDISFYQLTKLTGTRFVSHRRRAFKHLLDMWPAFISAYETSLALGKHKAETRAKIQGFLKTFHSYEMLCRVCCYLDILEKITPASLVCEGEGLLPFDVKTTIARTKLELEEIVETAGEPEEFLDSYLSRFKITTDDDGDNILRPTFVKPGHMRRKTANQEHTTINMDNMTKLQDETAQRASR